MEDATGDPWSGDEESDATYDETCVVTPKRKARSGICFFTFGARSCRRGPFAPRVERRDPQVLRAVHEGQNARAEIRGRQIEATRKLEQRGRHEPERLTQVKEDRPDELSPAHLFGDACETIGARGKEKNDAEKLDPRSYAWIDPEQNQRRRALFRGV